MTARIFIALFTLLALFACSEDKSANPGPAPTAGAGKALADASFADQDLARVLRWALKKPRGATITIDELVALTRLRADEQGITNLAGIQHCINLDTLLLWGNDIADIQPLADLTKSSPVTVEDEPEPEPMPEQSDDRAVLLAFYEATGGGSAWTGDNWGSDEPIGTWQGATTDTEGRITKLELYELGLSGSIPAELAQLNNLQWLALSINQLSGSIPAELAQLNNLTTLALSNNQLSGSIPAELAQLNNLQWLALSINQLSGSIPAELAQLNNLQWLALSINQLSGSIPAELAQLNNLQWLALSINQLSGSIPAELAQLNNLQWLWLDGNQLSGSIPAELAQLNNLQWLWLRGNNFSGCIPANLQTITDNDLDQLGLSVCDG